MFRRLTGGQPQEQPPTDKTPQAATEGLVSVWIPKSLHQEVQAIADKRGIAMNDVIRIAVRAVANIPAGILGMEDLFNTGKYRGEKVKHILKVDPSYILWMRDNYNRTSFSREVLNSLDTVLGETEE